MHYRDGTEAKLGDVVKGTGYNVKGTIVGTVVHLTPGTDACNIQVAHPVYRLHAPEIPFPPHELFPPNPRVHLVHGEQGVAASVLLDIEYGQCDAFELVHRHHA